MDSKLNYTIVGLFVALMMGGLIVFIFWLGDRTGNQKYDYYHVYMTESVSGLSVDANVKYLGVDVGVVSKISLNPENSEQVVLLLEIKQGVPIKVDTKATLSFFGVTGLAFIELKGGRKNSPILRQIQTQTDLPVIKSAPSTFSSIETSLNAVAAKSTKVLEKIDLLLSDDNLKNVGEILLETKAMIQGVRGQRQQIEKLIENGITVENTINKSFQAISIAASNVGEMADSLAANGDVMEQQFDSTLEEIGSASKSVESMAAILEKNYADLGSDLNEEVNLSLASFRQLINQMDILVSDMQRTTRAIEASPSDLFFKSSQQKLGPGEEMHGEK